MNKFKILISSCDNYSYLWDILKFSHQNYLGEEYKKHSLLISETKSSDYFETKNYTGKWKDMVLAALKDIEEEYILYIQDDYMFYKKPIPFTYFQFLVDMCKNKNIDHLLLTDNADVYKPTFLETNKYGELFKREYYGDYLASLQMGIWKRDYFIKLIESFHPNSIWEFELFSNQHCRDMKANLYLFYNADNYKGGVFEPSEIVRKGKVLDVIRDGGIIKEKWLKDLPNKKEEIENLCLKIC